MLHSNIYIKAGYLLLLILLLKTQLLFYFYLICPIYEFYKYLVKISFKKNSQPDQCQFLVKINRLLKIQLYISVINFGK